MISLHSNQLPRFQFFYDLGDLLKRYARLFNDPLQAGPAVARFEARIGEYFGVPHTLAVSSFRMGLYYTLSALELAEGDEVLVSPITIPDAINALLILKLKPVFVDLSLDHQAMDVRALEKSVTPRSRVLLLTYLSGIVPSTMAEYLAIAKRHGLRVIEDFSQNFEATRQGQYMGTFGDVGIGSLSAGKILSAAVGGVVLTRDASLLTKIRTVRDQRLHAPRRSVIRYYLKNCIAVSIATARPVYVGFTRMGLRVASWFSRDGVVDFEHEPRHRDNIFYTFIPVRRERFPDAFFTWLSDWQAELATFMLGRMKRGTDRRRALAKVLIDSLGAPARALLPADLIDHASNSYYHFPIYCRGRKREMRRYLFQHGIDTGSYGLNLNSRESCFADLNVPLPGAETVKHDTIFLPLNEAYSPAHMRHIARTLNAFVEKKVDLTGAPAQTS